MFVNCSGDVLDVSVEFLHNANLLQIGLAGYLTEFLPHSLHYGGFLTHCWQLLQGNLSSALLPLNSISRLTRVQDAVTLLNSRKLGIAFSVLT